MKTTTIDQKNVLFLPEFLFKKYKQDNSVTANIKVVDQNVIDRLYLDSSLGKNANYYLHNYYIKGLRSQTKQSLESNYYFEFLKREEQKTTTYQSSNNILVQKVLKLISNIGNSLFKKLSQEQALLMINTAGTIEFKSKIDINSVYTYLDTY